MLSSFLRCPTIFFKYFCKNILVIKALAHYTQNCKDFSKKIVVKIVANFWKKSLQLWKTGAVCMGDECIFCSYVCSVQRPLGWSGVNFKFYLRLTFFKGFISLQVLAKMPEKKTNRKLLCLLLNISNYGISRFVTTLSILYHFYDWHLNTDYIESKPCI